MFLLILAQKSFHKVENLVVIIDLFAFKCFFLHDLCSLQSKIRGRDMKKLNLLKLSSFIGACIFALGMAIGNSTTVVADAEKDDPTCNGANIQCASHLPDYLP
ncbi:MAG: hypothetical protein WD016_08740 [Balneolaceae bacterium]